MEEYQVTLKKLNSDIEEASRGGRKTASLMVVLLAHSTECVLNQSIRR